MYEERQEVDRDATRDSGESRRATDTRWVIIVGSIFAVVNLAIYAILYSRSGSQAVLINGIGIALGLVGLGVALWHLNRGRLDAAAYWVFFTLLVAYGVGELVWQDQTLPNVIGGVLLFAIVGRMALPGRWITWLAGIGVYGLGLLLINLFEPLPRQNALDDPLLNAFDVGALVFLLGLAIWQVIRVIARSKIRNRLVASFVLLVLLPAIILSAVSAVLGFSSGQQQAFARLELATDLRRKELEDWADSLAVGLSSALTDDETPMFVQAVLDHNEAWEVGWSLGEPLFHDFDGASHLAPGQMVRLQGRKHLGPLLRSACRGHGSIEMSQRLVEMAR